MKLEHILIPMAITFCIPLVASCSSDPDQDQQDTGSTTETTTQQDANLQDQAGDETNTAADPDVAQPDQAAPDTAEPAFVCRNEIPKRIVVDNPDETFDLGPYLMVPTPTSIIIKWRTYEETDGAVLYGLGDETDIEVPAEGTGIMHEVKLEGLTPETRYAYRVKSGGITSDIHHFYTAPPEGGSFQFAAWGDNQGGEPFPDVVAAIIKDQPHVLLGLGDHVSNGQIDELWKEHWLGPARALLHEVPVFAAFGNHGKNGPLYYELMAYESISLSERWESMYSFTYGNTFFMVIDTNGLFFPIGEVDNEWSLWIKDQVASEAAKKATWRIAYAHEPGVVPDSQIIPCEVSGYTQNKGVGVFLLPLLEEHNFHAYFSGHVHFYERVWYNKLLTIISGGGGGGLDKCVKIGDSSVLSLQHHFLRGSVGCDTLKIEAVDLEGNVFDWVEIAAGAPGQVISQGEPKPDP